MKKLASALMGVAALCAAVPAAAAEHLDIIEAKLINDCSFETYRAIVDDFNKDWGAKNGYKARIARPIQSRDVGSFFWIGTSEDAAAFGKAYDTWTSQLSNSNSAAAKLSKRFGECNKSLSRSGFYYF